MVTNISRALAILALPHMLFACAASQDVADAKRISLKDALLDTQDALAAVQARHTHFGYYGCTITTVFNVSATGTGDNKLALTASSPPTFPVVIGGSASTESTASGTRANTVTTVFATPYCLPSVQAAKAGGAKPASQSQPTNGQPGGSTPAPTPVVIGAPPGGFHYPGEFMEYVLPKGGKVLIPSDSKSPTPQPAK